MNAKEVFKNVKTILISENIAKIHWNSENFLINARINKLVPTKCTQLGKKTFRREGDIYLNCTIKLRN